MGTVDIRPYVGDDFFNGMPYDIGIPITEADVFMQRMAQIATVYCGHIDLLSCTHNTMTRIAINDMYDAVIHKGYVDIDLLEYTTYAEWRNSSPGIAQIIESYDLSVGSESLYSELVVALLQALFPINSEVHSKFVDLTGLTNSTYSQLKDLFISCCSYNIGFLDTTTTSVTILEYPPMGSMITSHVGSQIGGASILSPCTFHPTRNIHGGYGEALQPINGSVASDVTHNIVLGGDVTFVMDSVKISGPVVHASELIPTISNP